MKKRRHVLSLFLSFTLGFLLFHQSISSQGLKGKITYQATTNNAINLERIKNDTSIATERSRKVYIELAKNATPMNFHLVFNEQEAIFKPKYDRIARRRMGTLMNYIGGMSKAHLLFYDRFDSKNVLAQSKHFNKIIIAYDAIDWKFTQETKMIGGYKCYKATAIITKEQDHVRKNYSKPIVAWYTLDIPVHFGIRNFKGLPGLTMELHIDTGEGYLKYQAIKIELNTSEEIKIEKFKGKQITEDAYIKFMNKMNFQRRTKK
ncbi:GLPGLI family protein [Flavicella sediminum]|uniref:GLPGLI family protein n=1 Tax=Flavicella sediminum TaxID=2585141 RepID=UPI0011226D03|nr:GLPGLI family protein [Flavicella sediminum]